MPTILLTTIVGCGGGASDGDGGAARVCDWILPHGCDGGAPSYVGEVQAIVVQNCQRCHQPGGLAADKPLSTYAQIYSRRGSVLNQVYACKMPPVDQPPLDDEKGQRLMSWLVCGSPNN